MEKIEIIKKEVLSYFNVKEIYKNRQRKNVLIRQFISYLAQEYTELSLSEIAYYLGYKSHAATLYNNQIFKNYLSYDKRIIRQFGDINVIIKDKINRNNQDKHSYKVKDLTYTIYYSNGFLKY